MTFESGVLDLFELAWSECSPGRRIGSPPGLLRTAALLAARETRTRDTGTAPPALSRALAPRDLVVDLATAFADPSLMLDLAMLARRLRLDGRAAALGAPATDPPADRDGRRAPAPGRRIEARRPTRLAAHRRRRGRPVACRAVLPPARPLFIVVPIAELYVIIQVGQSIGALPTIALLIADSIIGALLMRDQGRTPGGASTRRSGPAAFRRARCSTARS